MAAARGSDRGARHDYLRSSGREIARARSSAGQTRAAKSDRPFSQVQHRSGVSTAMRNLITGMDVGTSKVCVLVGDSPLDGDLAILGYGVAPCTGLRKGVVVNIEATVEAIKAAVEEAEKSSGVR